MTWVKAGIYFAYFPLLVACMYVVGRWWQLQGVVKVYAGFILLTGAVQFSSFFLSLWGINNLPILHFYVPVGFGMLCWFYSKVMHGFIAAKTWWWAGSVFAVFSILNSILWEPVFTFNAVALSVESLLVVILALSAFVLLLNENVRTQKWDTLRSISVFNSGILIYFASNLLLYHNGTIIMEKLSVYGSHATWLIHSFFASIFYFSFIAGLWTRPQI